LRTPLRAYQHSRSEDVKTFGTVAAILTALMAVEAFYEHPTYGRGIRALAAVIQAGGVL